MGIESNALNYKKRYSNKARPDLDPLSRTIRKEGIVQLGCQQKMIPVLYEATLKKSP